MDTTKIGNFLTELRKEQRLTQEALGEKLGVTNILLTAIPIVMLAAGIFFSKPLVIDEIC